MTPQQMRAQALALRNQLVTPQAGGSNSQTQAIRNQMMRQAQAQRNQLQTQQIGGMGAPSQALKNQMMRQAQLMRSNLNIPNMPTRESPTNAPPIGSEPYLGKRWYDAEQVPNINQYYTPADRQRLGAVYDATFGTADQRRGRSLVADAVAKERFRKPEAKNVANTIIAERERQRENIGYGRGLVKKANDPKSYTDFEYMRQAVANPAEFRQLQAYDIYKNKFKELSRSGRMERADRELKQRFMKEGLLSYDKWKQLYG